uniref:(northern house mosquito) hypothetical protein n=1 Tax=Culex pipiens TaxID=7175 RepID=A0A8D8AJG2_CULPI
MAVGSAVTFFFSLSPPTNSPPIDVASVGRTLLAVMLCGFSGFFGVFTSATTAFLSGSFLSSFFFSDSFAAASFAAFFFISSRLDSGMYSSSSSSAAKSAPASPASSSALYSDRRLLRLPLSSAGEALLFEELDGVTTGGGFFFASDVIGFEICSSPGTGPSTWYAVNTSPEKMFFPPASFTMSFSLLRMSLCSFSAFS